MIPVLQVALDFTDLYDALELATKLSSSVGKENLWIEAGTPLIKSWGRVAVKLLKEFTGCTVVADTKTMDTGGLEAELFYRAGADVVTILGLADDSTVKEAIGKAREYNKLVAIDLINHPNPINRAVEVVEAGADIVIYHVGIDVQKKRGLSVTDMINELIELRKRIQNRIAVAGGIKHGDTRRFLDIGIDIIIVGSAITKSDNPVEATKRFIEELLSSKP
ncbi:MAG: orotidine 5'-phosphate decarboxylase / HUMPS family protein [Desulfurococcaceae archaeon]